MNGIDTAVASLLTSRVESLLSITSGTASAAQTGTSALTVDTPTTAPGAPLAPPSPPPASAQTALSAVALTLSAIAQSGGEATSAVMGQLPIWPLAPALEVEVAALPLFESGSGQTQAGQGSATSADTAPTTATTASASVAPAQVPVSELAAALKQTVAESGLFYESHLAQWLSGQTTPAELASEPQNRLLDAAQQLPLEWASAADGEAQTPSGAAAQGKAGPQPGFNAPPEASEGAARFAPAILSPQAARFAAGEVLAQSMSELSSADEHAALHAATTQQSSTPSAPTQSMAAAVHPATIPLVRQQLDMLATGQFRWTGEAWPGAKLDWTIQQDGDEWERGGGGTDSEEEYPWRTRLTLSLPMLGTVDAELTLSGTRLAVRVLASPGGAARLAASSDGFRQQLAAAGIELNGLSIREIGGGAPSMTPGGAAAAHAMASAYMQSAEAARRSHQAERSSLPAREDFDWDM
ncbi:MAG: flagellar hook-length control protein FliK [Paraburkholderia sp.]|nr:flagellar hook-length control protein FliK [Paraburkholderia sp.]